MYTAGLIGLNWSLSTDIFRVLVPFHLLSNAFFLLIFHKEINRNFLIFCIITILTGFFIELAGVKTGIIFGKYWYGKTLGIKLWEIPLVIGINWLVLVYITGVISDNLKIHLILKAMIGAFLMTALDFLIEPIAIQQDFWHWQNEIVPLQNYIAWFCTAFVLQIFFQLLSFQKKNPLATTVFILQVLFFAMQWFF
jgi:putative membrane protein